MDDDRNELPRVPARRQRFIEEGIEAIDAFRVEYAAADKARLKRWLQQAQAIHRRYGTPRRLFRSLRELDRAR